ncbi:MAG: CAAD domain-containing protein [Chamaesiphon sp.]|nr:CAAD domain-containing protein [Chamaesiphon sp.]
MSVVELRQIGNLAKLIQLLFITLNPRTTAMKTEIALHEIMRIDEYAEAEAETISAASPTPADAMKHGESPTDLVDNSASAEAVIVEESPTSVDTPAETIMNYDESPIESADIPAETTMSYDESTAISTDSPVTEPVMSDNESPAMSVETPAETVMNYDETPAILGDIPANEPMLNNEQSTVESAEELWVTVQTRTAGFFEETVSTIGTFFKNNRQLLTILGVAFIAILGAKLMFAGLNAIDDIPLVTPLLKLIGLVYVVRFVWRYLLREQDRHELVENINRTKAEVLGSQN